jgi:hypothetical protein
MHTAMVRSGRHRRVRRPTNTHKHEDDDDCEFQARRPKLFLCVAERAQNGEELDVSEKS